MAQLINDLHNKVSDSSSQFGLGIARILCGMFLGLTFTLIGDETFKYGVFAYLFVLVAVTAAFMRLSKSWKFIHIVIFILLFALLGMLLRLYVIVAPGQ